MSFGGFVDKLLWALLIAVMGYGASQLQSTGSMVQHLNESMASFGVQLSNQSETVKDHEQRIRMLERKR